MPDVLVLCYHAISPTWTDPIAVTPSAFDRQIQFLLQRDWRPCTFRDAVLAPPASRTLAVTFDDGFASVKRHALPILEHLGVPATVFVPTTFMSGGQALAWPELRHWLGTPEAPELAAMDWSDLGELAEHGWEIGSHTRTHPHLLELGADELRTELAQSRDECARELGRPCVTIAYPFGEVDPRVSEAARAAGYRAGAALSHRLARLGPYRYPRVWVSHTDDPWRFRLKATRAVRELRASRLWPS
jgi:peptidoglycan/xylan/chitin deacetylase (PgdA/CDA1 family)